MMKSLASLLIVLFAASLARGQTEPVDMPGAEVEFYKEASGDRLRIYRLDPPGHDPETDTRPALVLFNPVYDNGPDGYGHDRVEEWFPAISPAHNITEDDPPTIVFLGTEDRLIPVATAKAFRDEQRALGIRSDLHLYEGEPHGFFNLRIGRGKPEHFLDTVRKADRFLADLGYLEGEPDRELLQAIASGEKP